MLLVLVAGCGYWPRQARGPVNTEIDGIDAAVIEWVADSRPWTSLCERMLNEVRVAVTDDTADYCALDRDSCFVRLHERPWPVLMWSDLRPVIVLSARLDARGRQTGVIHETLHLLKFCSTQPHDGDGMHRTPRLWEKSGQRDSVEERAQARARAR